MIKVVEVIPDLSKRAGAEVFFFSLCKELSQSKEIELSIISLYNNVDSSFDELRTLSNCHFYTCDKKKGVDFRAAKKFRKIIKKINPTIIHTHRSILPTYFLAFGLAKRKWKIVHTLHSIPSKECSKTTNILRKPFIRKKMLAFVGISKTISSLFLDANKKAKIVTINNGVIDFDYDKNQQKIYDFISIGRFASVKNHKMLFDVFNMVWKKHQNIKLICLGDGELFDESKKYISSLPCFKNIFLIGATSNVGCYLSSSKVFVMSSIYEGNPISILEALHCGLPIVAPNVGGIPDVIDNNVNGILYPVCDYQGMYDSMHKLLIDGEFYNKMVMYNKQHSNDFSIHECSKKYIDFFYEINQKKV